ncbi:hypothetical protein Tco_0989254 [Tanacetum coccineum]|uniref:Uncharacterized protein n=1 Tax=Tanacetum coccineum TaxID=301880 RepID=A0ABQ5ETH0_9ASTR
MNACNPLFGFRLMSCISVGSLSYSFMLAREILLEDIYVPYWHSRLLPAQLAAGKMLVRSLFFIEDSLFELFLAGSRWAFPLTLLETWRTHQRSCWVEDLFELSRRGAGGSTAGGPRLFSPMCPGVRSFTLLQLGSPFSRRDDTREWYCVKLKLSSVEKHVSQYNDAADCIVLYVHVLSSGAAQMETNAGARCLLRD